MAKFKKNLREKIGQAIVNPKELRRSSGETQAEFWRRFGVTQSGGSRYECGREIPVSVQLLLGAYVAELVCDEDLKELLKLVEIG